MYANAIAWEYGSRDDEQTELGVSGGNCHPTLR